MKAATRLFGEIEIDESKIITFEDGIIGFPDMKKFTLIFDEEKEGRPSIHFLVTVHGRARDSISGNGSAVRL